MKVYSPFPESYSLIDAGSGFKLEKWGEIVTIRPEHQAYFKAENPLSEWRKTAHWEFVPTHEGGLNGTWKKLKEDAPSTWFIEVSGATFKLEITSNKHIGCFPEQNYNWEFISNFLTNDKKFLNAFAYTGCASVFGKKTGAEVLHCDSVKGMLDWANENQIASDLHGIKWVLEDALKFIERENKRNNHYDLIQLDPPAWGIGAKKEKWKLEALLPKLIEETLQILSPKGCLILNTYSPKVTIEDLQNISKKYSLQFTVDINELWMKSETGKNLYYGIISRFTKN